ncbi:MAG TPA: glycosyltransferase family 39 protein [Candidatus Acidoferrales bacterium]|nr:glycosyltransferase family 39 protein [Candidatus Acidoferrales bacterium]
MTRRIPAIWSGETAILFLLAGLTLALHLVFGGRYGFFRDELYYLACGRHLAWGYVDQPPLIAVVARLSGLLLGRSLFAVRFFPALAGAAVVFLTGLLARELGGGKWAQGLAALAVLAAPAYLAFDTFLSMNAFEPLFWMICLWLALRVVKGGDERLWLVFGLVAGVGLLNKNSLLVFGYALFVGLLASPARRVFYSRWIWLGALVALAIFLPNLLWQWRHGWPQIHVVLNGQLYKNVPVSPGDSLYQQFLFMQPVTFPIWLAGLWYFFGMREGREFRFLGLTYLTLVAVFLLLKTKAYYLVPIYPLLLSAGAVAWERWMAKRNWGALRVALPALVAIGGLVSLPYGVPVLPVEDFVRYQRLLPMAESVQVERDATSALPQLYADMFGWQNLTETVARVYDRIPSGQRSGCAVLAWNYGEAAAIDYYGPAKGLPRAISGHNNYYLWGPGPYTGGCVIAVGVPLALLDQLFGQVGIAARVENRYSMPVENNLAIYICREPRAPLARMWPKLRYYI